MPTHMDLPWHMGGMEWIELAFFCLLLLIAITLLAPVLFGPAQARPIITVKPGWRRWPETRLLMLALPLELLWEIAQFPLYDVWHQNDWGYILYGLAHCTLGDLLILLVIYTFMSMLWRDRYWHVHHVLAGGILFTLMGIIYTVFSEIMNVRIKGTWGYTELMPIVPVVEIGGTPFLQWVLIPPVLLWLMRQLYYSSACNTNA